MPPALTASMGCEGVRGENDYGEKGEKRRRAVPVPVPLPVPALGSQICYDTRGCAVGCSGEMGNAVLRRKALPSRKVCCTPKTVTGRHTIG